MLQLGKRFESLCRSGVAGDKYQIVFLRPAFAPFEEVRRFGRLTVLVSSEECHIEVHAGKLEVIDIPTERGNGFLGREHQPNVSVFLVAVEVVNAAVIECDDIGSKPRFVERFLFDPGHHGSSGGKSLSSGHFGGNGLVHLAGYINDLLEDVDFQVRALEFLAPRWRVETIAIEVESWLLSFCTESAATWWLVTSKPSGETNPPDPPLLSRTEASIARFTHSSVRSKPYFSLSCCLGGLLSNHIPSSETAVIADPPTTRTATARC